MGAHSHLLQPLGLTGLRYENPLFLHPPLPLLHKPQPIHTHIFWAISCCLSCQIPSPLRAPPLHLKSGPFAFPSSPTFAVT